MRHRLAAPKLAQQRDRLAEARAALADRHAAGLVLALELAADADPEDEATFAEVIEARHLLGHRNRVAQRQQVDGGAEGEPAADDGGLRQLQQRIEDRHREGDVVAAPERVVAAAIHKLDQSAHLLDAGQPRPGCRLRTAMDGHEADLELVVEHQVHRILLTAKAIGAGPPRTYQRVQAFARHSLQVLLGEAAGFDDLRHGLLRLADLVGRHRLQAQPRLVDRHGRVFHQIDEHAALRDPARGQAGEAIVAEGHEHDRRRCAVARDPLCGKAIAQGVDAGQQARAQLVALRRADDADGLRDDGRLHRRQRVREHVRIAVVLGELLHGRRARGEKPAVGRKALGKASHHQVDLAEQALRRQHAAAARSQGAEVVRHVDQQRRAELAAGGLEGGKIGRLGVHREQPLGDDHDAVARILGANALEPGLADRPASLWMKWLICGVAAAAPCCRQAWHWWSMTMWSRGRTKAAMAPYPAAHPVG